MRWAASLSGPPPEALLTSCAATWLGAWAALIFARAGALVRVLILTGLICLLALPAPAFIDLPRGPNSYLPIAAALGRALALVSLFCIPSAAAIPPGLRRAALAAGATKLRAWWDVVVAQLWLPAALGMMAAWLRG